VNQNSIRVELIEGITEHRSALLRDAQASMESTGSMKYHLLSFLCLGEANVLAGRPDDALACVDRAMTLARERQQRGDEAWAIRLHGAIVAAA
jgi:hypothetical protein